MLIYDFEANIRIFRYKLFSLFQFSDVIKLQGRSFGKNFKDELWNNWKSSLFSRR